MENKIYRFEIAEYNGGYEFYHSEYVVAPTIEAAEKFAFEYASNWYLYKDAKYNEEDNMWHIGNIEWEIFHLAEIQSIDAEVVDENGKLLSTTNIYLRIE